MSQWRMYAVVFCIVILAMACSKDDECMAAPDIVDNRTCVLSPVDTSILVNGDQSRIVAGKLLSYAVSTEDECAYSPPGKWVNLYGITYYRYGERGSGDNKINLSGLYRESAEAAASILTTFQLDQILTIVPQQLEWENHARRNRDSIARELYQWKDGNTGDEDLILGLSTENGILLKEVINQRTRVYANIINAFSDDQKRRLCLSRNVDHSTVDVDILRNAQNQLNSEEEKTTLNLLLSKLFTWATGTVEMNGLVDDGRPAVYFGFANLRIEDRDGDDISSGLRKDASDLVYQTLKNMQKAKLDELITMQSAYINAYFSSRAALATKLIDYQSTTTFINQTTLSNMCINSELLESQLAILQAKELGSIIESMDNAQLQVLRDFKDGN